ncbi:Transthyretin-like family-containing protein [Strongyloides ratti]|uniref:Transthyretin-like family-containing protein n=1 Tax=Strongyloides ratti TaxID=34506 RepID=A0A090L5F2_STRRB|nr:Transthyretin-like family-containing protein [Strongyloides ratti]CEF63337.1 Transthyretin-like family-containing protein [Strongyloides ratti]
MNFILSIFLIFLLIRLSYLYKQDVSVSGQLLCNRKRAVGIQIYLKEKDTFDPDDTLDATISDFEGKFKLDGVEDEFKSIKPYIEIIHKCEVSNIRCNRSTIYSIDQKEIGRNYDFQYINLNIKGHSDFETC